MARFAIDPSVLLRIAERAVDVRPEHQLVDRVSRRVAWRLAEELGLDDTRRAEYLAVAQLQGDHLVTLDDELARAARGLVHVLGPDALGRA